jgi:predicted metal-dependent hydrolase
MAKQRAEASDSIESGNLLAFLVRSPRRTVSLQVNPDLSLVIKAPVETPEPFLRDFLERRRPWVERHLERMARIKEAAPVWANGGRVPFLGDELVLKVEAGARSRARFGVGDLFGPVVVVAARDPSDAEEVRAAVERLFSREAAARFPSMLDACLERAARPDAPRSTARRFPRPELRVRTMRSRWGSCDAKAGVVTLNARLLRFRPEVIDCVIMHELAHLKYRRHGPRFYGLLEELCPEYKALQAELAEVYLE